MLSDRAKELLAPAQLNADYWEKATRDAATEHHSLICAFSAVNAWKNAAYAMAEKVASLEAFKRSVDEALNTGNGSYKP